MATNNLADGIRNLDTRDKRLLLAFFATAILALALGIFFGAMTAAGRTGLFPFEIETAYKMLGLHGVTIFLYWLYFVQAGFVLILASAYTDGAGTIAMRPVGWLGFGFMLSGLMFSEFQYTGDVTVLYDGNPELLNDDPSAGRFFYLGTSCSASGYFSSRRLQSQPPYVQISPAR